MSAHDPAVQLPLEIVEPLLLTCIASVRSPDLNDRLVHRHLVACLCVIRPSRQLCTAAARFPCLGLISACEDGHLPRLEKLYELGLCADAADGRGFAAAIMWDHVAVLDWWRKHKIPVAPRVGLHRPVDTALEYCSFDAAKWVAEHRIPELATVPLDSLRFVFHEDRADVVHAWLDWTEVWRGVTRWRTHGFGLLVVAASDKGHVDVLERLQAQCPEPFVDAFLQDAHLMDHVLVEASARGDVRTLQWWTSAGASYRLAALVEHSVAASLHAASESGQVAALVEWKRSRIPLTYTNLAMDRASAQGHVDVLAWWVGSGLELRYSEDAMTDAAKYGHFAVLAWWNQSGLELKLDLTAVLLPAMERGDLELLNWWLASGLPLSPIPGALDLCLEQGNADVLAWWERAKEHGNSLEIEYSGHGVLYAILNGAQETLDWMCRQGMDPKLTAQEMGIACKKHLCGSVMQLYFGVGRQGQCPRHSSDCPSQLAS